MTTSIDVGRPSGDVLDLIDRRRGAIDKVYAVVGEAAEEGLLGAKE